MIDAIIKILGMKDLRRRIFYTLGILFIWRIGTWIPVPGVNGVELQRWMDNYTGGGATDAALAFLNVFTGGALERYAIFSLGIMPYISASIIMQMATNVMPALKALQQEGESGRQRIGIYTRWLTLGLCLIQGTMYAQLMQSRAEGSEFLIVSEPGTGFFLTAVLCIAAGAMFVMWLGEQITERGLGNGASILIMAGIVARMPQAVMIIFQNIDSGGQGLTPQKAIALLVIYILMIGGIIFISQGQRRVPLQTARFTRGMKQMGGERTYIPLRVNQAGVMPIIFASAIIQFLTYGGGMLDEMFTSRPFEPIIQQLRPGLSFYTFLDVVMIFLFTYFYVSMIFNPKDMADHFRKQGHFIPGVRPGPKTVAYLEFIMNRITLAGAAFLAFLEIFPALAANSMGVDQFVASFLGGTGLLIVVGVFLHVMEKVESEMAMRNYEHFTGGSGGAKTSLRGGR